MRIVMAPLTQKSGLSLEARALWRVASTSPSVQAVATLLRVERGELERCLQGEAPVSRPAFLRAVEFIMDDLDARERAPEAASRAKRTLRVLIVDDNADGTAALSALLRHMGHSVEVAHDGYEALHAARRQRPDIILLDISLPGIDGFQVAAALRGEPGFDGLKIVAISGRAGDEERQRSREVGIDHYLVKPVDLGFIASLLGSSAPARPG
jgi:CheY-like chemotaxis protein